VSPHPPRTEGKGVVGDVIVNSKNVGFVQTEKTGKRKTGRRKSVGFVALNWQGTRGNREKRASQKKGRQKDRRPGIRPYKKEKTGKS